MNAAAKEFDGVNKYIRITDIDEKSSTYKNNDIVSPDGDLDDKYIVRENDILFARTGASTGKTYIYNPNDGVLYFAGFLIRANVKTHYDSKFIYQQTKLSRYNKWVNIMSARSGQPGINSQEYSTYKLFLPTIEEQQKVSAFINLLDKRIEAQNKIIQQLQSLIKGIYDKVFEDISDYQKLSSVCTIQKGQQVNGEELSELGDYYVMNGGIEPSGYYDRYNTYANTISISEGGNSCGYVQYNNVPFWSGGHCYTLQNIKEGYHNLFLYHYLKAREKEIMALRIGSGLPNIQKKDLEKFFVPILPLETQVGIVDGINKIETKLKQEKDILSAYQKQKAYLLRNLFI